MNKNNNTDNSRGTKLMHYGMMACCVVMLLPVAGYFLAGGNLGSFWGNSAAFLPLIICGGAHVLMHKMMGKSCHEASDDEKQTQAIQLLADNRAQDSQSQRI